MKQKKKENLQEIITAVIETAASQTNKTASDFCSALLEYAAIVRGIAKEYQGQATIEIIRLEHPELDFMDDEDIQNIIEQGLSFVHN